MGDPASSTTSTSATPSWSARPSSTPGCASSTPPTTPPPTRPSWPTPPTAFLIGTAMRPHAGVGQAQAHVTLSTGVLSHTLTYHERCPAAEWHFLQQRSSFAGNGRSYGQGDIFRRRRAAGRLVRPGRHDPVPLRQGRRPLIGRGPAAVGSCAYAVFCPARRCIASVTIFQSRVGDPGVRDLPTGGDEAGTHLTPSSYGDPCGRPTCLGPQRPDRPLPAQTTRPVNPAAGRPRAERARPSG